MRVFNECKAGINVPVTVSISSHGKLRWQDSFQVYISEKSRSNTIQKSTFVSLSPNPTKHNLSIVVDAEGPAFVYITSISGQQFYKGILEGNNTDLDLSTYPEGVYIVRIQSGHETVLKKFTKL